MNKHFLTRSAATALLPFWLVLQLGLLEISYADCVPAGADCQREKRKNVCCGEPISKTVWYRGDYEIWRRVRFSSRDKRLNSVDAAFDPRITPNLRGRVALERTSFQLYHAAPYRIERVETGAIMIPREAAGIVRQRGDGLTLQACARFFFQKNPAYRKKSAKENLLQPFFLRGSFFRSATSSTDLRATKKIQTTSDFIV